METTLIPIADRVSLHQDGRPARLASFADDVRRGLTAPVKSIPPKYFYDQLGSALFEAITCLPEYYLTRVERDMLARHASEMIAQIDGPIEMLELGSGSATKTRLLIEAAIARQGTLHYKPVDISPEALIESARGLAKAHPQLTITAFAGDYLSLLASTDLRSDTRYLALFLGSNIGNFQPDDARELLRALSRSLKPGDALLLGTDLKKNVADLEAAYDDPTGVTAAFNKNLLARINRELGGDFDVRAFDHIAEYDPARGAIDSFLEARTAQDVAIAELGLDLHFAAGERIHTESSYKFSRDDIARLAAETGYTRTAMWVDAHDRYALTLLTITG